MPHHLLDPMLLRCDVSPGLVHIWYSLCHLYHSILAIVHCTVMTFGSGTYYDLYCCHQTCIDLYSLSCWNRTSERYFNSIRLLCCNMLSLIIWDFSKNRFCMNFEVKKLYSPKRMLPWLILILGFAEGSFCTYIYKSDHYFNGNSWTSILVFSSPQNEF